MHMYMCICSFICINIHIYIYIYTYIYTQMYAYYGIHMNVYTHAYANLPAPALNLMNTWSILLGSCEGTGAFNLSCEGFFTRHKRQTKTHRTHKSI